MKHTIAIISVTIVIILLGIIGTFFFSWWPGLKPVLLPPVDAPPIGSISTSSSTLDGYHTVGPYTIPNGFTLSILTESVPSARDMLIGAGGELIVSQTKEGRISLVDTETGNVTTLIDGLNRPHGLLLSIEDPNLLYIAEEDMLASLRLDIGAESYTEIMPIPAGGRHYTRSLVYNAEGDMLMSIGSMCDTCEEENSVHGTIQRVNLTNRTLEPYATGLRNAVFMTLHELDGSLWATEMGRDFLGNDLPPDELNRIQSDAWYGWPWFYGDNVFDEDFANGAMPSFAKEPVPATVKLPAHVAPLGLDTVPEEGWPEEYWYDILVAYHGSWNRTPPIGYEVVRHRFDSSMNYLGAVPFILGWLTEDNRSIGRPVDILTLPGGTMYISDDAGGRIYEMRYTGTSVSTTTTSTIVSLPYIQEVVDSSITANTNELSGEALGTWYFEASFPIDVIDANAVVLDTLIATAQADWMTTSSVPFTVPFDASQYIGQTIAFVLRKDNPSGEPQFDASTTTSFVLIQ